MMDELRSLPAEPFALQSRIRTGNEYVDRITGTYKPVKYASRAAIVLHGYGMSEDDTLPVGDVLNSYGISALQLNIPYHGRRGIHGEGFVEQPFSVEQIREAIMQAMSDVCQAREYLRERKHGKVAIGGYSLGGILTLLAMGKTGFDFGFAAFAGGDLADLILNSPITTSLRADLEKHSNLDDLYAALMDVEPCTYAHDVNPSLLAMVNGKFDDIVPPRTTMRFIERMASPPRIEWLDCGHFTNELPRYVAEFAAQFKRATEM